MMPWLIIHRVYKMIYWFAGGGFRCSSMLCLLYFLLSMSLATEFQTIKSSMKGSLFIAVFLVTFWNSQKLFKTCCVGHQIKENNMRNTEWYIRKSFLICRSIAKVKYNGDCGAFCHSGTRQGNVLFVADNIQNWLFENIYPLGQCLVSIHF